MPHLHNKSSHQLKEIEDNSIDALITDPPYGISYQKNEWDKSLPSKKENTLKKTRANAQK